MEIGWAKRYGVYPGDRITIAVGEQEREFAVTSVRKADWNTFRPNFFVLLNPNAVGDTRTTCCRPSICRPARRRAWANWYARSRTCRYWTWMR